MIRTRDFLLYVVVLLFLLVGIGFTVAIQSSGNTDNTLSAQVAKLNADSIDPEVYGNGNVLNREANLQKLREKIAEGEGKIAEGEPVLYSVDSPSGTPQTQVSENLDALPERTEREPRYCPNVRDDILLSANWPAESVTIELVEGARLVRAEVEEMQQVGSSTAATTTSKVLLQLPVSPQRVFGNSCIDSEVIGVALDGSLIHNDETWRFRSASHESVIGYARDGFPIYGQGVDESLLDSCGGYDSGVGYRYHLREGELFVLGCYAGVPRPFLE